MRIISGIAIGAIFLFSVACGSSGGGGPSPSISVSPPSATVTVGGSAVAFTATLTGSTDSIAWTLDGPGSITPSSGTSTSYTPPATVASATTATLTATAGTLSKSVTITVQPPAAVTVTGKIVASNGQPIPNASVIITGHDPVNSDTNGIFTVTNVTTPYELTCVVSTSKVGVVYKELTRVDPTIVFFAGYSGSTPNSATIAGSCTGAFSTMPLPAGQVVTVAFGSPETTKSAGVTAYPYSLSPSWFGPVSTTGTLHALEWTVDAGNLPTAYKAFGEKASVTVSNSGGTLSGQDIVGSAVTLANVAGTINVPTGYTISNKTASLVFADKSAIALFGDSSPNAAFNYVTPSITSTTLSFSTVATSSNGFTKITRSQLAASTSGLTLNLQPAPTETLPVDGATNVTTSTSFTWQPFANGIHLILYQSSGNPTYIIVTSSATTTIPNLTALGLSLPVGASYNWTVLGVAPFSSVDALAAGYSLVAPGDNSYVSFSAAHNFTTAP